MRAAPPCRIQVVRIGIWRSAVLLLGLLGGAALATWVLGRNGPVPWGLVSIAVLAAFALAATAASLMRLSSFLELRWDGQGWHLGASLGEPTAGDATVALDFGVWMLLRFVPSVRRRWWWSDVVWIPVQRRGLEAPWHAFRCALYSPRTGMSDGRRLPS